MSDRPLSINALLFNAISSTNAELPLQTHHVGSTLKRGGNDRFHVFSTWNPRAVFVGKTVEESSKNRAN